jgi:hypothetical protein
MRYGNARRHDPMVKFPREGFNDDTANKCYRRIIKLLKVRTIQSMIIKKSLSI